MQAVLLGLLFLSVQGDVSGADALAAPTLFGKPVRQVVELSPEQLEQRKVDFAQMLTNKGWVHIGDQVRPGNGEGGFAQPSEPSYAWETPPHRSTIFLNFFGAALSPGTNAARNESSCLNSDTEWPGFNGTEAQALALIDVFERQMEPYGVRIAYEEVPPPELPYAMVMMGGSPGMLGLGGSVLGVSCSSDCGDNWWRDTTFAFTDNINPNNADTLGTTALHEAAHAFGLAHIGDASKVMNPFVGNANVTWADSCVPYDNATGGINCQPTHDEFCGGGSQNSDAELTAYFGANSPDLEPPTVEITTPADGLELAVGSDITIEAEIEDNYEGVGWKLVIPEVDQESVAFAFEKKWTLSSLPQGVYTIRVEAIDHDRNTASDEVTIYVGVDPASGGSSSGGDEESSGGEPPGDTGTAGDTGTSATETGGPPIEDDGESDTDTASASGGGGDEDKGCGCTTDPPRDGRAVYALGTLVLLLGVGRRRAAA